jgi:hypothetical protein
MDVKKQNEYRGLYGEARRVIETGAKLGTDQKDNRQDESTIAGNAYDFAHTNCVVRYKSQRTHLWGGLEDIASIRTPLTGVAGLSGARRCIWAKKFVKSIKLEDKVNLFFFSDTLVLEVSDPQQLLRQQP